MALVPTFISFDFDYDQDLRNMLVGQSKHPDTPFSIADWSLKEPLTGDWIRKIESRINRCQAMIVICGVRTHLATGVAEEIKIARKLGKSYFLLWGRSGTTCFPPYLADGEKIYEWTWQNLKMLIGGAR